MENRINYTCLPSLTFQNELKFSTFCGNCLRIKQPDDIIFTHFISNYRVLQTTVYRKAIMYLPLSISQLSIFPYAVVLID